MLDFIELMTSENQAALQNWHVMSTNRLNLETKCCINSDLIILYIITFKLCFLPYCKASLKIFFFCMNIVWYLGCRTFYYEILEKQELYKTYNFINFTKYNIVCTSNSGTIICR